jgi:hypothetical protein
MFGGEVVVWIVIIGFGMYFALIDGEHRRSRRISDELKEELEERQRWEA